MFTVDLFLPERHKEWLAGLSVVSLIAVMVISLVMRPAGSVELYGGLIVVDGFGLFFKIFFCAIGVGIIALSVEYGRERLEHRGEFYGLLLFSILGMNLIAMSRELLTAYIALELLSFSLYVMVAYGLREARSNEAGIKYIIIGALSSAIMLYGLSNIYAALGTTYFAEIAATWPRRRRQPGAVGGRRAAGGRPRIQGYRRCPSTCGRRTPTRARRCR